MTAQQLQLIANLIDMLSGPVQQALFALLNQTGIDPDKLLELAAHNNQTALVLIESEINRVGANIAPSEEAKEFGDKLLADLTPKDLSKDKAKKDK